MLAYEALRLLDRLKLEGEELAKYGVAKRPDKQSIDTYSELVGMEPVAKEEFYNMDPTGRRTGNGKRQPRGTL